MTTLEKGEKNFINLPTNCKRKVLFSDFKSLDSQYFMATTAISST